MENKKTFIKLLRVIHYNADVNQLIDQGLRYSQISQLLNEALTKGLITAQGGRFLLTQSGKDLLLERNQVTNDLSISNWIEPLDDKRKKPMDPMAIYLPSKKIMISLKGVTSTYGSIHRGDESSS